MKRYDPTPEIRLTARTGFLSKSIWSKYFAKGHISCQNKIWALLSERGHFKRHPSTYASNVLILNPDDLLVKKITFGEYTSPPSVAVLNHDEAVTESFLRINAHTKLESSRFEGELKRLDLRDKRHLDPRNRPKYPDLMLGFSGTSSDKKFALEFELSRKGPRRYRQIMTAYLMNKEASVIVFITAVESIERSVRIAMRDTHFPDWKKPVGFVSFTDWQKNPMTAPIRMKDKVTTLEQARLSAAKAEPK